MTTATGKSITATEMIGEHIQEKVEMIQERRAAANGRLHRAISFLFNCKADNPHNLQPAMQARLYL